MWLLILTKERWYLHNTFEFNARVAETASRWRSLVLWSLPPGGYNDLQITYTLQHLESFKILSSCNQCNFMEALITTMAKTVTPRFTVMEVFHPDSALYIAQPAHFRIFSFLTTIRLICRRMQNPVDILPSLHKLEIFEAHHLSLPIYPPAVDLPLTQTLRVLRLKSVSVQWTAGRIFLALKQCSIIFPHHADTIQSVYMPSCLKLKYDSNNLGALEHFHIPHLDMLTIKCGQWRTWTGSLQLIAVRSIFAAQSLTCLYMEIKCSERLLAYMLRLIPDLEELCMVLSSPHALSGAFFLAFAGGGRNAIARPSSQAIDPLCRNLKILRLDYKRWSRGAERNGLIPVFGAIVASHPPKKQKFSLRLRLYEGPNYQEWKIHAPVKRFGLKSDSAFIGVSSPHGIVHLSSVGTNDGPSTELEYLPFPMEAEYITTPTPFSALPIDYLFSCHSLKEVRMHSSNLKIGLSAHFSYNKPLFHTLKVLAVRSAPLSCLAGQTFHKLERYHEERNYCRAVPGYSQLIEMSVCTRLVVPLSRLAMLKLPQVCELSVFMDRRTSNSIWGKHIAVIANLSGLKLLHLRANDDYFQVPIIDVMSILGSLPALETLVFSSNQLFVPFVTFFGVFFSMNTQGTSELNQPSWKDQKPGVVCPRLESLQFEGISLIEKPELMAVLEDVVSLRAINGSPLKSFTFYHSLPGKKWELIGSDRSFIMEEVVPAREFRLDI